MKIPIEILLYRVSHDLRDAGADFAVVGALAVAARTEPRFTRDVDVAVPVDSDEQAEQILGYLIRYGYRPIAELDRRSTRRLVAMRMIWPHDTVSNPDDGQPIADIIFSLCGIEHEVVAAATPTPVFCDLTLPTARIPHLIAMKLVSESRTRYQDRADLHAMILSATDADLLEVPPLLDLIIQRGFAGKKNLHARWTRFRAVARR